MLADIYGSTTVPSHGLLQLLATVAKTWAEAIQVLENDVDRQPLLNSAPALLPANLGAFLAQPVTKDLQSGCM